MKKEEEIYLNRANPRLNEAGQMEALDETACERCGEILTFAMKDKEHEFSLGLYTVIQCLHIAEEEGYVPKLPDEWWVKVMNLY